MARTQISPETIESIKDLHAAGLSARKIASNLGISASTVSKYCKRLGLKFDRAQTVQASETKKIDLEAQRLKLAERMIARANRTLDEIEAQVEVFNFGGKDNTFVTAILDRAPVDTVRSAMTTAAIAFDKASRIVERQAPNSQVAAANMLTSLAAAFGIDTPGTTDT